MHSLHIEFDRELTQREWRDVAEQTSAILNVRNRTIWTVPLMPVPRCETCAHWKQASDAPRPTKLNEGICLQIQIDLGQRLVKSKARLRFENINGVGLATDADFGCTEWSAK